MMQDIYMKKIYSIKIYNDKGVETKILPHLISELSPFEVSFLSSAEIFDTNWESDIDLFILPGGRDVPFHESLKGKGNQRIRQYVENGGSFLGICAGAYYGCRQVEFDRGRELEVLGMRELAFFPGIARGPAYGPGSFRYNSEFGAKSALISNDFENSNFRCYYNGGCYFVNANDYSEVKVLSRYLEVQNQPAAVVEIPIGNGRVILSGVHLEIGTAHPSKILKKEMTQALSSYEESRQHFFQQLLHNLLK